MEGICFNDEGKCPSSFLPAVIRPKGFHPSAAVGKEDEIMSEREREREELREKAYSMFATSLHIYSEK